MKSEDILLVGCGNMGGAMLKGWIDQGRAAALTVIDPDPAKVPGTVRAFAAPDARITAPRAVVLAIKPQMLVAAAPALEPLVAPGTILVSILAAVPIAVLRRHFPRAGAIVRAVPNLPASIGAGITALVADALAPADRALIDALFAPLGPVEWLASEAIIDAATSVSGCGPAFLFRFAAAAVEAGVAQGLDRDQATRLFAHTMIGAGQLLAQAEHSPADMARRVASPGGVTLAGLAILDRDDALMRLVAETLAAAGRRSAEMAADSAQAGQDQLAQGNARPIASA